MQFRSLQILEKTNVEVARNFSLFLFFTSFLFLFWLLFLLFSFKFQLSKPNITSLR